MVQTLPAKEITLAQLNATFKLDRVDDEQFFTEWQDHSVELTDLEKQTLDEVKANYIHLSEYPLLESLVKLVVLSPLLKIAGFYRPPFYIGVEKEIELLSEDEGTLVRGRIDVLIFQPQFWVLVIEAKRTQYSLDAAIPQALLYMLANPDIERPAFGFVTNGREFQFIKLITQNPPKYALSYTLSLNRGNDLYTVASSLKHLAQLATQPRT
ncbi:MAG: restriction endonuclease subunit R [Leptolyngbyaceae cyanobacterium RM2_2_4]|nr:restriction endonuclease subunit R [Leptolyngbyaceae cyanobacterium RM2_2_4]